MRKLFPLGKARFDDVVQRLRIEAVHRGVALCEQFQQPVRGRFKFGQQENEVEIRQRLGDGKVVPVYEIGGTQQPSAPVQGLVQCHLPPDRL